MARPEHLAELDRRARARFDEATATLRSNLEAQLRDASERLFSAVADARVELPDSLVDAEALDALADGERREGAREAFAALLEGVGAFDRAATQGAVLEALLAAARRFAPRAALLLTRHDGWQGWGAAGFSADADPLAGTRGAYAGDALEAIAAGRGVVLARGFEAEELAAALGLPAPAESCLVPLVLRDRVAAALYVDRLEGESEPPLAAFQLLTAAAAQRVELQPLSSRASTPTFAGPDADAAVALPLWSAEAATLEAPPAEPEPEVAAAPEAEHFAFVTEEAVAPAEVVAEPEPEAAAEEELESTGVSELFATVEEPAVEAAPEATEPVPSFEPPPADAAAEPEAAEVTEAPAPEAEAPGHDYAAEFVPVEEEQPLMPGEPVFEPVPDEEAPVIELVTEEAAEPEVAPESTWQMEEGEATAYLGTAPSAPEVEVGETTAPVVPFEDEGDLSETRAISTGAPTAEPRTAEPPSPASTIAFQAPPDGSFDPNEDATVMIDRGQTQAAPPPEAPAEEDANDRTAARAAKTTEVAPPPDLSGPGLAFSSSRGVRASGESALHDEARRLARLLISEIKLYNEDQVEEGRRNRDLYHRLKDDIDRSRQIYEERVHESVRESSDYFQQELVRSLAGGDSRALGV